MIVLYIIAALLILPIVAWIIDLSIGAFFESLDWDTVFAVVVFAGMIFGLFLP